MLLLAANHQRVTYIFVVCLAMVLQRLVISVRLFLLNHAMPCCHADHDLRYSSAELSNVDAKVCLTSAFLVLHLTQLRRHRQTDITRQSFLHLPRYSSFLKQSTVVVQPIALNPVATPWCSTALHASHFRCSGYLEYTPWLPLPIETISIRKWIGSTVGARPDSAGKPGCRPKKA